MNNLTPLTPLVLDPAAKVAEGVERQIYVHPEDPTRLIKIMKARPTERYNRWTFSHLAKRYMPSTRYRPIAKQYDEFRRVMFTHHLDPDFIPPICHLYGFVPTTLGLGGVTERVTDRAGNNAPTLWLMVSATAPPYRSRRCRHLYAGLRWMTGFGAPSLWRACVGIGRAARFCAGLSCNNCDTNSHISVSHR